MDKAWKKTLKVACQAITTMEFYLRENKHTSLNRDTITLASLVFNIGVLPILTEAERHPEVFANPSFLAHAIQKLGGKIGGTIMREWEFTDEFIEVAEVCYVDFIRVGAIVEGILQVSDKTAALKLYQDKGVIREVSVFADDDYLAVLEDVKSMFA